jgi:hypothetical protein
MSKRKRRQPFTASSHGLEKYLDRLDRTEAQETVSDINKGESEEVEPTDSEQEQDSGIGERRYTKKSSSGFCKKIWSFIGIIVVIGAFIGIILGVGWYFWDLNSSMKVVKSDVNSLKNESADFRKEYRTWKNQINESFVTIKEKLDILVKDFFRRKSSE